MTVKAIEQNAEAKFNEILGIKGKDIIIDFFATWCGPCKMLKPVLENVAEEKSDTLDVYTVNIDEHPEFAIQHSVTAVPTVMFIRDGKIKATEVGFMSKDEILDHIG